MKSMRIVLLLYAMQIATLPSFHCGQTRSGYFRTTDGQWHPDISECAHYEFPPRAKKYVDAALIIVEIQVDVSGTVTSVTPKTLEFEQKVPREIQEMLTPDFEQASIAALLYEKCPVHTVNGKAVPYKLTATLFYEIKDNRGIRHQPRWGDEKPKERWIRRDPDK